MSGEAVTRGETEGFATRLLNGVERVGNRLPDPVTLFLIAIAILILLSAALSAMGIGVVHPGTKKEVLATNLLDAAQIRRLLTELPQVFATFPPLAMVLIVMMGVGVAERTGLIAVGLGAFVRAVPRPLLSVAVSFAGVQASLATDAGYVVLTPLAAALYASVGRHPIAGLACAFAGVAGGFSANLLVTGLDPLLAGLTQAAARLIDPGYTVYATANYYLMVAFVPLFSVVGALVTDRIVEPRLLATSPYTGTPASEALARDATEVARERRGLRFAGITLALVCVVVGAMVIPDNGVLRDPKAAMTIQPFLTSLIAILFVAFLLCGIAYGVGAGTIRSDKDAVGMMSKSMADMGGYIVLAFACAVFIALFGWSNLGVILAVNGAEFLSGIGFTGLPLMVGIIAVSTLINILIGSASAKWAILAPVLVPLLMQLGVAPEATQAAYRVGDAATNMVTPLLPYFPLILIMAQRYLPGFGIGSLIATMLPYCIWYGLSSTLLFGLWFGLDLPLGPGVPNFLPVR